MYELKKMTEIEKLKVDIEYYVDQINYLYNLIEYESPDLSYAKHRLGHWFDSNSNIIEKP